jgi:uncharacterized protein (TIGR02594 family)
MVQLNASRRLLHVVALAVCSLAMAALATPASARSHHHGAGRHARAYHHHHRIRHTRHRYHGRHIARASRSDVEQARAHAEASVSPAGSFGSSSNVVAEARRYIGGNPTGRGRLWCARFMNMVLQHAGLHGTGSDMARSFASYGQRVSGPQVGAIAVMGRRGGGHVGVVSGIDASGNPIVVSGNHGHRVAESVYPRSRIYAYVMPTG